MAAQQYTAPSPARAQTLHTFFSTPLSSTKKQNKTKQNNAKQKQILFFPRSGLGTSILQLRGLKKTHFAKAQVGTWTFPQVYTNVSDLVRQGQRL